MKGNVQLDWKMAPWLRFRAIFNKLRDKETLPVLSSATEGADTVLNQFPFPTWYALKSVPWKTFKGLLPGIIFGQIICSSTYCLFTGSTRSRWSKCIICRIQLSRSQTIVWNTEMREQLGMSKKESKQWNNHFTKISHAQHIKAVKIHTITERVKKKLNISPESGAITEHDTKG